MENEQPHINYSAADFERYHNGSMPAAERWQLEKAALDDPFLADALEGFALTPTPTEDSIALQKRLDVRLAKEEKKGRVLPFGTFKALRIAALFILLAGLGYLVYKTAGKGPKDLAVQTVPAPPVISKKDTLTTAPTAEQPVVKSEEKEVVKNSVPERPAQRPEQKTILPKEEEHPVAMTKQAPTAATPSLTASAADTINIFKKDEIDVQRSVSTRRMEANAQNLYKGKVVDEKNNPVPNVSVTIKNKKVGTTTDGNGEFTLSAPDTALNVVVNSVGFDAKEKRIIPQAENEVVLKQNNNALAEVVVVGYGTNKKSRTKNRETITIKNGSPVNDLDSFKTTLKTELKKVADSLGKNIKGKMILSFSVDKNGEPIAIKVDQSIAEEIDAAAIQFLKQTQWKATKKTQRIKVTIDF